MEATAAAATESASTTAPRHARDIRPLRIDLDVPTFENAIVQNEGRRDRVGLGKLDICVARHQV